MINMLKELVNHLRENQNNIVRNQKIYYGDYDPTYGMPTIAEIETIDFTSLLDEIDSFAETFIK